MSLNPRFLWQIIALLSAVYIAAAAVTTKCAKKYDCVAADKCADRHGGVSQLESIVIFKCEGDHVCCPPLSRITATNRRTNRENETKKRRMRNQMLFSKNCGKKVTERVNGPNNRIKPGDIPWMALLSYMVSTNEPPIFHCGGTLITDRYVLTAAHCVKGKSHRNLMVRLGEVDLTKDPDCVNETWDSKEDSTTEDPAYSAREDDEFVDDVDEDECGVSPKKDFYVEKIIPHKGYSEVDPLTVINDIALLRLNQSIGRFSVYISPICLPWGTYDPLDKMEERRMFSIAGWGIDMSGNQSNVLKNGIVELIGIDDCKDLLHQKPLIINKQQCSVPKEATACMGDSGGPLSFFDPSSAAAVQLGIVSYSNMKSCVINVGNVIVYTKVFAYKNWILDTIRPNDNPPSPTQ